MRRFVIHCIFALIVVSAFMVSCVKEREGEIPESGSLVIVPSVRGASAASTKASDTDTDISAGDLVDASDLLRENFFSSLDIFVKRSDDSDLSPWFKTYHITAGSSGVVTDPDKYDGESLLNQAKQWLSDNWGAEGFDPREIYDVYVTANNPHTAEGSAPGNLSALKALSTYEYNIFRYYRDANVETWDSFMRDPKQFLMDGSILGWRIDQRAKEQTFDVALERAAAKVIVNIRYSDEDRMDLVSEDGSIMIVGGVEKNAAAGDIPDKGSIKEYLSLVGREPGELRWKYVKFGFRTADIAAGGYLPDPNDSGVGDYEEGIQTYSSTFNAEKVSGDADNDNINSTYSIVTYSYPVDWSSDYSMAPCIILAVFYTKTDNPSDSKINYYRIPVCDESSVTSLERNNIYIVDVDIASLGSSTSPLEQNDEELRIEYHIIPWTDEGIAQHATTTVNSIDTKYLMVNPVSYTLKGNDVQTVNLHWYASVSKDDDRIVDIDASSLSVQYVNYLGNTVSIRGTVSKTTLSDGTIQLTSTAPSNTADGEQVILQVLPTGYIRVLSEALHSKAVKEINFRVILKNSTLSEVVHIRHFPLDNIQSIEGWWSSKVSTEETSGTVRTSYPQGVKLEFSDTDPGSGWTRYTVNGTYRWYREVSAEVETVTTRWMLYDQIYYQRNQIITSGIFTAKVVNFNGWTGENTKQIVALSNPANNWTRPGMAAYSSSFSSLINNYMYVIQTTVTSDGYMLGRPVLDSGYQSLDKCVSPAFMIASQLGAVTATSSAQTAATHCGTYMEVGVDGKHYLGWRLPTGAEIGAILNYQNNSQMNGKTIVEVLGGNYYWALDGRAYSKANGTVYTTTGSNYVRCVRDLTLEEVKKLNNE